MGPRDVPPRPLKVPADRHHLSRVGPASHRRAVNTVVESWVDMEADLAAINRGEGRRSGDDYEVNGRVYRQKPNGGSFPLQGPGVHPLGRAAYRALGVYNAFGETDAAEAELDRLRINDAPLRLTRSVRAAERRSR